MEKAVMISRAAFYFTSAGFLLCRGTACITTHHDRDFDRENRETACFLFHSRLQQHGNSPSRSWVIQCTWRLNVLEILRFNSVSHVRCFNRNLISSLSQSLNAVTVCSLARSFNQRL